MRVLFIHPDDDPERGPWRNLRWDRVFDLALAGPSDYSRWTDLFRCPVLPVPRSGSGEFRRIRQILSLGLGRLIDDCGFDWWDLLLLRFYENLERVLALRKVVECCSPNDEIFVSRPGLHLRLLQSLFPAKVSSFPRRSQRSGVHRLAAVRRKLNFRDMLQVLGDKYDAGYRFRRLIARPERPSSGELVLLPSAYGNASKTALSYAHALPDMQFLLAATRSSAVPAAVPRNVRVARLASYAPGHCSQSELGRLLNTWSNLRAEFRHNLELSVLQNAGLLNNVPALLNEGLSIRDAWRALFRREPIASVLSADEGNPYTRLPLLIAKQQSKPAQACHHGALDLRYLVRNSVADTYIAKGRMEADYLTGICGFPREKVRVACASSFLSISPSRQEKTSIIFFSEPYELAGIRAMELYLSVLPRLADLAVKNGCDLILKLHPFESRAERGKLAKSVLSRNHNCRLQVVSEPLTTQLLQQAWFGVAASSTAVVDCALNSVPAFLLTWVDDADCGYSRHFLRFRAAAPLGTPEQISRIPDLLSAYPAATRSELLSESSAEELRRVLLPHSVATEPSSVQPAPEAVWA